MNHYVEAESAVGRPSRIEHANAVPVPVGLEHVERNGHHYFRGLSMLPTDLAEQTLAAHGDLYSRHAGGFPTLRIRGGAAQIGSVVDAPFGVAFLPDLDSLTRPEDWQFESLGLE